MLKYNASTLRIRLQTSSMIIMLKFTGKHKRNTSNHKSNTGKSTIFPGMTSMLATSKQGISLKYINAHFATSAFLNNRTANISVPLGLKANETQRKSTSQPACKHNWRYKFARIPNEFKNPSSIETKKEPLTEMDLLRIINQYKVKNGDHCDVVEYGTTEYQCPEKLNCKNTADKDNKLTNNVCMPNTPMNCGNNLVSANDDHRCDSADVSRSATPIDVRLSSIVSGNRDQQRKPASSLTCDANNELLPLKIPMVGHFNMNIHCANSDKDADAEDSETSASSSTSSLEDIHAHSMAGCSRQNIFPKFIPVYGNADFVTVPKILLNKRNKTEWRDVQLGLIRRDTGKSLRSSSDSVLAQKMNAANTRSLFKSFHSKIKTVQAATLEQDMSNVRPKSSTKRFDPVMNERFCQLNASRKPNFIAIMYVELHGTDGSADDNAIPNLRLCHHKTELAVAAILNFFHPYCEVQCLWVRQLQDITHQLIRNGQARPKFARFVYLRHFSALLLLSSDAGIILRHDDTAFVRSLAAIMQIDPSSLLIMVQKETSASNESFD